MTQNEAKRKPLQALFATLTCFRPACVILQGTGVLYMLKFGRKIAVAALKSVFC